MCRTKPTSRPAGRPTESARKVSMRLRPPRPRGRSVQAKAPGRKRALPGVLDRLHTGPPADVSRCQSTARASLGFQNAIFGRPACQRKVPPRFGSRARRETAHKACVSCAGVPWTEGEHRLFLLGLQKLGKVGCWSVAISSPVVASYPPPKRSRRMFTRRPIGLTFYEWGCAGRLARHLSVLRDHADAHPGREPRPEALHPAVQPDKAQAPVQPVRHHRRWR